MWKAAYRAVHCDRRAEVEGYRTGWAEPAEVGRATVGPKCGSRGRRLVLHKLVGTLGGRALRQYALRRGSGGGTQDETLTVDKG